MCSHFSETEKAEKTCEEHGVEQGSVDIVVGGGGVGDDGP
jgi:hypothetical protein